jgi:hypothetical protein
LLSAEQKSRIIVIAEIFRDVFPDINETWISDFSRDENPETEIKIWESIGKAFLRIEQIEFLSDEQKQEAFDLLFMRSLESTSKVLEQFKLKTFSKKDAKEILRKYENPPSPLVGRRIPKE